MTMMKMQRGDSPVCWTFLAVLVLLPVFAEACAMCSHGLVSPYFKGILWWELIGLLWFVIFSLLYKLIDGPSLLPGAGNAIVLAIFGFFFGFAMLGPFILLPILFWCIIVEGFFIFKSIKDRSFKEYWGFHSVSFFALIMLVSVYIYFPPSPRTPVDALLNWEGTIVEKNVLEELLAGEPDTVSDYRRIVSEARTYAVPDAAARLIIVGEKEKDLPHLIDKLEDLRSRGDDYKFISSRLEEVIRKWLRSELPEGTSIEKWREEWERQKKISSAESETTESPSSEKVGEQK